MTAFDDERERIAARMAELDRMILALDTMLGVSRAVFQSLNSTQEELREFIKRNPDAFDPV